MPTATLPTTVGSSGVLPPTSKVSPSTTPTAASAVMTVASPEITPEYPSSMKLPREQQQQQQQEPLLSSLPISSSGAPNGDVDLNPYPSLAQSPSTPQMARILLPVLCLACHVIFYYGQTEPMWKLHVNATIDVWANATDYTARRACDATGLEYENHLTYSEEEDVQTFTYMYAIHELWRAKDLPGTLLPRLAAILLVVFSGLWPHLKLLMLNITWFWGKHPTRRTRTLQWLSGLGKWSLADVLVVCVMVGVLHLDWIVDPDAIKEGIVTDLPSIIAIIQSLYSSEELCDKMLKMECSTQKRVTKIAKCKACNGLISEAYYHPEWAKSTGRTILDGVSTNGGGLATLRVVGMGGIYAFCGAVILSIVLSLVVDVFDVRAKARLRREQAAERGLRRLAGAAAVRSTYICSDEDANTGALDEPLLINGSAGGGSASNRSRTSSLEIELPGDRAEEESLSRSIGPPIRLFAARFFVVSLLMTLLVVLAVDSFSMERLVHGAGPQLLHEILGVNWEKLYCLRSLMWTTGGSGGWDYLLMGTFGLFCVLGPILRAVLLVTMVILDQCHIAFPYLSHSVNFLGSFCSWEVFAIAIIMVQMLMPSITKTIVQNPACAQISDDGSCLQVEFNVVPLAFSTVILGGFLLVGISWVASSRASKNAVVRERLDFESDSGLESTGGRMSASLSRVMQANHDYQRLRGIEEEAQLEEGNGLEELVFETNNV